MASLLAPILVDGDPLSADLDALPGARMLHTLLGGATVLRNTVQGARDSRE
jgi:hypothetical protein